MMNPMFKTALETAQKIRSREISAREVVQHAFNQIDARDGEIGAFLSRVDSALEQADSIDAQIARGEELGPLAGVPIALKDNLNLTGTLTTAGSKILEHYRSPYSATVVNKLLGGGVIPVGKTNMDEFAQGSSTEKSAFQLTRNPHDLSRVPGGTSGGSAAAVSAGFVPLALGTDTGGSVRQPAAFCGTLGFKPTYGRISRYGVVATASSLDQVGALARSSADLAALLDLISGHDPLDATSLEVLPRFTEALKSGVRGMRFGYIKESLGGANSSGVNAALERVRVVLEGLGATFGEISLPALEYNIAAYYIINTAEISSNLARYDGMVYSSRVQTSDFNSSMSQSRGQGFGPEVLKRILMGTYALSSGYYDAFYSKALKVRRLIANDFARAFEEFDVLVTPTSPFPAFKFGEFSSDPLAMYLADVDTVSLNLAGLPGISVPAGMELLEGSHLPIGIQFIGPVLGDERLLSVSQAFETATSSEFLGVAPRA